MTVELQQGDVKLFQTNNGGEISVTDGLVLMAGSLETSAYLSLFGGNEDDDGRDGNVNNWWANFSELDPNKHYRSETQNLLRAVPLTTGVLRRVEDAAKRDLAWLVSVGAASSIEVEATIPALNTVKLDVRILAVGEESSFEFIETWKADIQPQVPLDDQGLTSASVAFILAEDDTFILAEDGTRIKQE